MASSREAPSVIGGPVALRHITWWDDRGGEHGWVHLIRATTASHAQCTQHHVRTGDKRVDNTPYVLPMNGNLVEYCEPKASSSEGSPRRITRHDEAAET
ncbi:hypothetical protein CIB48_g5740 [Xylaria polymorpha]|nr:hypothetical protein CIB48_g5740 [Xylaria polymorpha]